MSVPAENLSNQQLVDALRAQVPVPQSLVDEYYRRCIPLYLDFIGLHWHTGFYRDESGDITPQDQLRMVDVIANSIDISESDRVLDVGCGLGGTVLHLAQRHRCHVVGLTPVVEQRDFAQQLIDKARLGDRASVILGHAAALPFPNDSFDRILFFESPCHFQDRDVFFSEAMRVLKPGGQLAGEDWLASSVEHTGSPLIRAVAQDWAIPALGSGESYLASMRACGFRAIEYHDMRSEMSLGRGFAVTGEQQLALQKEIDCCPDPLLGMTLKGLLGLGQAVAAGVFTIGRFKAHKPELAPS